jgi:hypothetical protein
MVASALADATPAVMAKQIEIRDFTEKPGLRKAKRVPQGRLEQAPRDLQMSISRAQLASILGNLPMC